MLHHVHPTVVAASVSAVAVLQELRQLPGDYSKREHHLELLQNTDGLAAAYIGDA